MNTSTRSQLGLMFLIVVVAFAMLATTAAPALAQEGGEQGSTTTAAPSNDGDAAATNPNQIRNRVFLDLDGDGNIDSGEPGLAGVTVNLVRDGATVATTTTDAAGQYIFRPRDGVERGTDYRVRVNLSTNTSALPGGVRNGQLSADAVDAEAGRVNHTAATLPFDLELRASIDTSTIDRAARTATFNLTVVNQGQRVQSFQLINYLDQLGEGQWADFAPGLNPNGIGNGRAWSWNDRNERRPIVTVTGGLATGAEVTIPVVLRWANQLPTNTASLRLAAEISNFDDGNRTPGDAASGALEDRDSTPDRQAGNDRNEDDYATAGFGVYDLALSTTLADGSESATILPGSRVSFTITVANEGLVSADDITIVNYLPNNGLRLVDPDWTQRVGGTADITIPGRLAPGAQTSVTIDFVSGTDATGTITNSAEIASATPVNSRGQALVSNNRAISDVDSTADRNGSNDPAGEDDRDGASVRMGFFDLALNSTLAGSGGDAGVAPIGNAVVFNLTVVNEGTVPATDINLVNYLPRNGVTLVDPDWQDNGNGTASLRSPIAGPLAAGASVVVPITFVVDADAHGTIYNWAEIGSSDTDGDPSTPTPVDIDSEPANNPRYDSTPGAFVDFEELQRSAASATPENSTSLEDVEPEEFDPNAELEVVPQLEDTTSRRTAAIRPASEDDHDVAGVTVEPPRFDLSIGVFVDDKIEIEKLQIGDEVIFTIVVNNEGNVFADDIQIVNYLPESGLIFDSQSWTDHGDGTATIDLISSIAPDSSVEVDIRFEVGEEAIGTIENSVEISDAAAVDFLGTAIRNAFDSTRIADVDSIPRGELPGTVGDEDDFATALLAFAAPPDFNLSIFADLADGSARSFFQPGDTVTYSVTVLNSGVVNASAIDLITEVPEGFTVVTRDWEPSPGTATRTLKGILTPGEAVEFDIEFRAGQEARGNADLNVRILGATSVDDVGSVISGTNGLPLNDLNSSDDSTVLELSVIPTLAFNGGAEVNVGGLIGWGVLAAGAFIALMIVSLRRRETTAIAGVLARPTNSRFGPA